MTNGSTTSDKMVLGAVILAALGIIVMLLAPGCVEPLRCGYACHCRSDGQAVTVQMAQRGRRCPDKEFAAQAKACAAQCRIAAGGKQSE